VDRKVHYKTKLKHRDDWFKSIFSTPFMGIQIYKIHNTPFCAFKFTIFIIFYCINGNCGKSWTDGVFYLRIFGLRDRCQCRDIYETGVFFVITLPPDILVRRVRFVRLQ